MGNPRDIGHSLKNYNDLIALKLLAAKPALKCRTGCKKLLINCELQVSK